ncbi:MAG: hypothetical protein VKJ64_15045 [Leptolyngbyaceae bacterium]|nr:hypothetical protein [Leptolyngbyaceae bacterium]
MAFFRQYIAPIFIVLIFLVAMVAVSARIFLPDDLAAPAPIEDPSAAVTADTDNLEPAAVMFPGDNG